MTAVGKGPSCWIAGADTLPSRERPSDCMSLQRTCAAWVSAPRPATARTADIIGVYNLLLQLSVNGGADEDNLVVAANDIEFEGQAEWSSLLWWLQNQHYALSGVPFGEHVGNKIAPIFCGVIRVLCPGVPCGDTKWNEAFSRVKRECRRRQATYDELPAMRGSFFKPRDLLTGASLSALAHVPVEPPCDDPRGSRRLSRMWKNVAVDALTVHVVSSKKVTVMIPLNRHLLQLHHDECGGRRA